MGAQERSKYFSVSASRARREGGVFYKFLETGNGKLAAQFGRRRSTMNWDQVEGQWKQIKGSAKQQWGKLTDDDLDVIAGKKDQLLGKLQERYGIQREEAKKQAEQWCKAQKEMREQDTPVHTSKY
jgi:uncharacterized protein YjbJ (UPF0337 family)